LTVAGVGGFVLLALPAAVALSPWRLDQTTPGTTSQALGIAPDDLGDAVRLAVLLFVGTLVPGALAVLVLLRTGAIDLPRGRRFGVIAVLSVAIASVRTGALSLGLPAHLPGNLVPMEFLLAAGEALIALGLAAYYVDVRRQIRAEEQQRLAEAEHAARVSAELEHEELRVRREVSQRLHGGLQQRLVVAAAQLDEIERALEAHGEPGIARSVHELIDTLDTLREREVRALAHGLYPWAADLDLDAALALLADQLPPSVHLDVRYGSGVRPLLADGADPTLSPADRVALFSTVEEGVTNALRHGDARRIAVAIEAAAGHHETHHEGELVVRVTVDDDGSGLTGPGAELAGLAPQRARARRRGGDLTLGASPLGGARLDLRLPVRPVRHEVEELR